MKASPLLLLLWIPSALAQTSEPTVAPTSTPTAAVAGPRPTAPRPTAVVPTGINNAPSTPSTPTAVNATPTVKAGNLEACLEVIQTTCYCGLVLKGSSCMDDTIKESCTLSPGSTYAEFRRRVKEKYFHWCRNP